uniref:Uncharacterized protein n=1 Tax=Amphimedon queenslandica TaxID=400682 RepID=A0A1X7VAT4_AMPQE
HNGTGVIVGLGVLVEDDNDDDDDDNDDDDDDNDNDDEWTEFDDVDPYEDNNDVYEDKEGLVSVLDMSRNDESSVETSDERERDGNGKSDEERTDIEGDSNME